MDLCNKAQIFCPVRRSRVSALPEELVRQYLLQQMIRDLGYSSTGFALEQSLHQMPHIVRGRGTFPTRRADMVYYAKGVRTGHGLYPLLLIECKAVALTEKVIRQVVGYNFYVQAPFVAVVNETESHTGYYDKIRGTFGFEPGIPPLSDLLARLSILK